MINNNLPHIPFVEIDLYYKCTVNEKNYRQKLNFSLIGDLEQKLQHLNINLVSNIC